MKNELSVASDATLAGGFTRFDLFDALLRKLNQRGGDMNRQSYLARGVAIALVLLGCSFAGAKTDQAAQEFHDLFRSALPSHLQTPESLSQLHMLPDDAILAASEADTAAEAVDLVSKSNLSNLIDHTRTVQAESALNADDVLRKRPVTLVIVPGIFGEFIKTRGFEDVLMKPSADREAFERLVKTAAGQKRPVAFDNRYSTMAVDDETVPLTDVINIGSLTDGDGRTLVKVVLLYTSYMSLESLADAPTQAEIFNRRISKYLELTGPQELAFVGYSRGTVVALEMLSQAKAKSLDWLPSVKGMIGLGGVIWGSALADQFTQAEAPMTNLLHAAQKLRSEVDPDSRLKTYSAWLNFFITVKSLWPQLQEKPNAPKTRDLVNPQIPTSLDRRSIASLFLLAVKNLGLIHFVSDHADNVRRFQRLFDAALDGLESLKTKAREDWWATHTLPKNVTYYAMTAAMANPEANSLEKSLFDGPLGYSNRSYDDLWLLQNRLDYQGAAKISLNDSQVSIPQAMFLPNAIARLSPTNTGLKTQMLGTVGTHHWGLALRVVNEMNDGRTNPFPRESLLKALAAKVALDQ